MTDPMYETLRELAERLVVVARIIVAHVNALEASDLSLPGGSPDGAWEVLRRKDEFYKARIEDAFITGFIRGADWLRWMKDGCTSFPSERDEAEKAAKMRWLQDAALAAGEQGKERRE